MRQPSRRVLSACLVLLMLSAVLVLSGPASTPKPGATTAPPGEARSAASSEVMEPAGETAPEAPPEAEAPVEPLPDAEEALPAPDDPAQASPRDEPDASVEAPPTEEPPADEPPAPRELTLSRLATGLGDAVAVVPHPLLPGSHFVLDQAGRVRLLEGGRLAEAAPLDLTDRVKMDGESGLHALAFHPHDPQRAFLFYNAPDLSLVLDEVRLLPDLRGFDPASRAERLRVPAAYGAHNGGALAFGPDGFLYVSVGDGGRQDDPDGRAQDLASWNGKILRIDVDVAAGYAIPPGNPFPDGPRPEVWLYGFRNPWRMAFDAATGDLWIADVGGSAAEEINLHAAADPAGANYGWRVYEGATWRRDEPIGPHVAPVHEYVPTGGRCAVTGGMRYRGPIDELRDRYVYADFCDGRLRTLAQGGDGAWRDEMLLATRGPVVHLAADHDGALLVLHYGGALWRLAYE